MYIALVILSVFAAACAQMLLKQGARHKYATFLRQYINVWVISGYVIMGCTMILNVFCLSRGVMLKEVSIIESLSYLFVPILSLIFFKEKITLRKILAIALIMVGIAIFFV